MATSFARPKQAAAHINADPQKDQAPDKALIPGLEHRPFTDDEIQQAFDTFDLTKKHFVGATEIRHILDVIGEEATDEEVDEMIRMCDSDGKGQVTYDEFYKMMTQPPPPPPVKAPRPKARASQSAASYMQRSATMGEKALTGKSTTDQEMAFRASNVEALVRKLAGGLDKIKPSQIKKVYKRFQEIDEDNSGAIEFSEFCKALDMPENTVSKQMFRVFDMDGSGSIELKEFIVVLSRYTSAAKTEKLKFAFMMFDEDGSGKIEREELIEMLQASFVVEGYSREQLEEKADKVYEFLKLGPNQGIGYDDFLKIATAKNGLIYPLEETRYDMATHGGAKGVNMTAMFEASQAAS